MRLTTGGIAHPSLERPVVGKITWEHLSESQRFDRIFACTASPKTDELKGYRASLCASRIDSETFPIPLIHSVQETTHLRNSDIIGMQPRTGFVRTLYRPDSDDNTIFATDRCNSNCLMCSQPPKDRDDVAAMTGRNLAMIELIDSPPKRLVITGGEPTLLGDNLLKILAALKDKFPATYIHMLTNGRIFAWQNFTAKLAGVKHPNFMLGIPLYSDDSRIHDYVVQARDAFSQTVLGLQQLARYGLRVEIRVVLHALTIPRLPHLAEYIYRNCTFAEHIALMGMENIGYVPRNIGELWIDPYDYQDRLEEAVEFLSTRGLNVSIYNHQLCTLRKSLWKYSRKSISDWKNIYLDQCQECTVRHECGGFFQWAKTVHSAHINPIQ
jgi:His-Xaa-Ser system radical SAM maturase HxsC